MEKCSGGIEDAHAVKSGYVETIGEGRLLKVLNAVSRKFEEKILLHSQVWRGSCIIEDVLRGSCIIKKVWKGSCIFENDLSGSCIKEGWKCSCIIKKALRDSFIEKAWRGYCLHHQESLEGLLHYQGSLK